MTPLEHELTKAYSSIERIDPESPTYKKLIAVLDNADDKTLLLLARRNIKWVSRLALNRCVKRGLYRSKLSANPKHRVGL